jgi:hypothetical protein
MTKRELQEHSPKSCISAAETGDNQPILKFWVFPHSLENCHPVNINFRWIAACYDGNIPPTFASLLTKQPHVFLSSFRCVSNGNPNSSILYTLWSLLKNWNSLIMVFKTVSHFSGAKPVSHDGYVTAGL